MHASAQAVCAAAGKKGGGDDIVFTAGGSGLIRAWDAESHRVLWRTLLNELVRSFTWRQRLVTVTGFPI